MTCHDLEDLILEGMATADMDIHLETCASCREFVRVQRALDLQLHSVFAPPHVGEGFGKRLTQRRRVERVMRFKRLFPEAGSLAGGLLSTLACVWLRPGLAERWAVLGTVLTLLAILAPALVEFLAGDLEEPR